MEFRIFFILFSRPKENKEYALHVGNEQVSIFCHLTDIPGCGGGGWTLVMKTDGSKVHLTSKMTRREIVRDEEKWKG